MPAGFLIGGARTKLALNYVHVEFLKQHQSLLHDLVQEQIEKTLNNHRMVRDGFESDDQGREICLNDVAN